MSEDEVVPDESEQLDQLQQDDSLIDRGVDDPLDEGIIVPDDWSPGQGFGNTAAEQAEGETLDQRLKQEVPDDDAVDEESYEFESGGEVGTARAGRLVESSPVDGDDVESELLADEVGIDGGAASAEEAAVHIVEE